MRIEINSFSVMSSYVSTVVIAPRITDNNFEAGAIRFLLATCLENLKTWKSSGNLTNVREM